MYQEYCISASCCNTNKCFHRSHAFNPTYNLLQQVSASHGHPQAQLLLLKLLHSNLNSVAYGMSCYLEEKSSKIHKILGPVDL
jgi:hypothetical protein